MTADPPPTDTRQRRRRRRRRHRVQLVSRRFGWWEVVAALGVAALAAVAAMFLTGIW